jgi:hypothetical protein
LFSVCLSDLPAKASAFAALRDLADRLDAIYRFREIVLVLTTASARHSFPLVEEVRDVRLFVVRRERYYQRRKSLLPRKLSVMLFCHRECR